jgi:hypothetical protein
VSVSGRWWIVRRYLVVANQTLGGEELWGAIRERIAGGAQLDPGVTAEVAAEGEPGEDLGRRLARQRMRHELDRMRELGASVSGEIGVADPVDAVRVVLHRWEFDEVILSTLPGRRSRWLAADLPTKIRRGFKLQVTQVTGATAAKG